MTLVTPLAQWLKPLAALLLAMIVLGGCALTSDGDLLAEAKLVAPFGDALTIYPYEPTATGYSRTPDAPTTLTLAGNAYSNGTDFSIRFARFDDTPHRYLISISNELGHFYGLVDIADGIAQVRFVMTGGGDFAVHKYLEGDGAPHKAGIEFGYQRIAVLDRATLDDLLNRFLDGTIPTEPLVVFVATGPGEAAPQTILRDGDRLTAQQ